MRFCIDESVYPPVSMVIISGGEVKSNGIIRFAHGYYNFPFAFVRKTAMRHQHIVEHKEVTVLPAKADYIIRKGFLYFEYFFLRDYGSVAIIGIKRQVFRINHLFQLLIQGSGVKK